MNAKPPVHCSLAVIYRVFWRQSNWEKSDYVRSTQRIILLGQISSGCSVIRNRLHFKRSLYHRAGGCVLEIGNRFGNGSHGGAHGKGGGRGEWQKLVVTALSCRVRLPPGVRVCPSVQVGRRERRKEGVRKEEVFWRGWGGKKAAIAIKCLLS